MLFYLMPHEKLELKDIRQDCGITGMDSCFELIRSGRLTHQLLSEYTKTECGIGLIESEILIQLLAENEESLSKTQHHLKLAKLRTDCSINHKQLSECLVILRNEGFVTEELKLTSKGHEAARLLLKTLQDTCDFLVTHIEGNVVSIASAFNSLIKRRSMLYKASGMEENTPIIQEPAREEGYYKYGDLKKVILKDTEFTGDWIILHAGNGLYLWPRKVKILDLESKDSLLGKYEMAFEIFHMQSGTLKISLRIRLEGPNYRSVSNLASSLGLPGPQDKGGIKKTKALACWTLGKVKREPEKTWSVLKQFFMNPPTSFKDLINEFEITFSEKEGPVK